MRPFRNPANADEWQVNLNWRTQQVLLPPGGRDLDSVYQPAWRIDDGEYLHGYTYDPIADAWDIPTIPRAEERARADLAPPRRRERDRDMAANDQALRRYPPLNLAKLPDGPDIPRDIKLPPFKIDYDSHEQFNQKLTGTVVLIKNMPFIVSETACVKGKYYLVVYDNAREQKTVCYDDIADVRGIAPGYFTHRGAAFWTYRVPERQNSQGMHQRNMRCKPAGADQDSAARSDFLLAALGVVADVKYADNLHGMILGGGMQSIRLTNRVALYNSGKKGAPIAVEYCGRPLGLIVNGQCKVHDEYDLGPSWMHKDVDKAGLVLTA